MLFNYLRHLDRNRWEPRVCVFRVRDGNPIASEIEGLGIPVDLIPVSRIRDFVKLIPLVRYLRRHRFDLVHTQLEAVTVHGGIAAKLVGLPAVHTLHTFAYPNATAREVRRSEITWFALRNFHDQVIAVSAAVGEYAIAEGRVPREKITVLYNGIDTGYFRRGSDIDRAAVRKAFGIPLNAALVVTVAVLRREKGIQYLIEAWPKILESVPKAYYLIVGAGPYEDQLKSLAATYQLTDRVLFAGARSDIPAILGSSDLFVLPTLDDVLPTVLAEAMASGLPIIASRVGGVPEMVEHGRNGLLIQPGDPAQLAAACVRLLRAPDEARRLGQGGLAVAEARFNVRKQVQELENTYRALLERQRSSC